MSEYETQPAGAWATGPLAEAERLGQAVRRESRWYVRYLVAFGVATIPIVTWAGFLSGPVSGVAFTIVWAGFVTGISVLYAGRQRVHRRRFARLHLTWLTAWFAVYCAVLIPGVSWFHGQLAWWLPGGVVVSLPCFVAAYLEQRR